MGFSFTILCLERTTVAADDTPVVTGRVPRQWRQGIAGGVCTKRRRWLSPGTGGWEDVPENEKPDFGHIEDWPEESPPPEQVR